MANELIVNIDKVHTTIMGIDRIKKNINIDGDVVEYCKKIIINPNTNITKKGKNWYCTFENKCITINASSYTIITAHNLK